MNIKVAELIIERTADYNNEVVKTLEDAGYILTRDMKTSFEVKYIVAKTESEG